MQLVDNQNKPFNLCYCRYNLHEMRSVRDFLLSFSTLTFLAA